MFVQVTAKNVGGVFLRHSVVVNTDDEYYATKYNTKVSQMSLCILSEVCRPKSVL